MEIVLFILAAIFFSLWMAKRAMFNELGRRFDRIRQRNAELVVEVAWREEKIEILERQVKVEDDVLSAKIIS